MPTREQTAARVCADLSARGLRPQDPEYLFALQAMEDMNAAIADLDDELADIAARISWLARAPTWANERPPGEFERFVNLKLSECEGALISIRARWRQHQSIPSKSRT